MRGTKGRKEATERERESRAKDIIHLLVKCIVTLSHGGLRGGDRRA
jgi:hypothetical protein